MSNGNNLRVLVACEFSQVVTSAFLSVGCDAWSCDILPCAGNFPDRHFCCDVLSVLDKRWDLIIAHPPCTFLSHAGECHFNLTSPKGRSRWYARLSAADFFLSLYNAPCSHVCVENPVGFMNLPSVFRAPDQIIQPFHFGDPVRKRTCFWLRGLPRLTPNSFCKPSLYWSSRSGLYRNVWERDTVHLPSHIRRSVRSVFFPGVASSMASQWTDFLMHKKFGFPRKFPGCQMEFDFS